MPETVVRINPDEAGPEKLLRIRINGVDPTFRIGTERIERRLQAPVDDLLLDLLDVVASVFAADSTLQRGGATRPDFGAGWRRRLAFTIPVRRPEVWSEPKVSAALRDAVEFLTDDEVTFQFEAGRHIIRQQDYLDFDPAGVPAFQVEDVILFSGGLDSLSGALERLTSGTGRIALVTHKSAPKTITHQMELAKALADRFPGRILHVPVRATRTGPEAPEHTQRSRSLLFAALGHVVARMLGAKRISFFENGIVSQNLPISRQVIGTMATRTTHPLSLVKLGTFLDSLGGVPISIENRFAWLTKTEVVTKLAQNGGADLIRLAVSCTSVREQTRLHTHCGACSQCLDRRFAILSAGLEAHDPAEMYGTDILSGPRDDHRSKTMALDWTAHAVRLTDLSLRDWMDRFGSELLRIVEGYPTLSGTEVIRRTVDLQQRHGRTVRGVLEAEIQASPTAILNRSLPETSLLRMFLADRLGVPKLPDVFSVAPARTAAEPVVDRAPAASDEAGIFPLQVSFDQADEDEIIRVVGLGEVRGAPASVAHGLRPTYEQDLTEGRLAENHRFVPSGRIPLPSGYRKDAVRKNVQRCRAALAEYYRAIEDRDPPHDLLIENRPRLGYRLDPTCKVVAPGQGE